MGLNWIELNWITGNIVGIGELVGFRGTNTHVWCQKWCLKTPQRPWSMLGPLHVVLKLLNSSFPRQYIGILPGIFNTLLQKESPIAGHLHCGRSVQDIYLSRQRRNVEIIPHGQWMQRNPWTCHFKTMVLTRKYFYHLRRVIWVIRTCIVHVIGNSDDDDKSLTFSNSFLWPVSKCPVIVVALWTEVQLSP